MDVLKKQSRKKVLKKPRPIKNNQKRSNMISRSNILKKIIKYLENGECQHMLYWNDKSKREFVIKFVHMNSQEFKKANYLKLFEDLDKLSKKYEEYKRDDKYDHNCKVRCKSNLKKLCGKALTFLEKYNVNRSIQIRRYRLNDESLLGVNNLSEEENLTKQSNIISLPAAMIIVTPTLYSLGSCSSIEKNDKCDSREYSELCAPIMQGNMTVDNIVTQPTMSAGNLNFDGLESCSSIEKNDKYKSMEYGELLVTERQGEVAIQNGVTLPTTSVEYSALNGLNSSSSIERSGNCEWMEECGESSPLRLKDNEGALNIEEFQDTNNGIKNKSQMVPSSPLGFKGNFDEFYMDDCFYDDMLLLLNDPFLSSASSNNSSTNLPVEKYLSLDPEVFRSDLDLDSYVSSYQANL